MFNSKFALCSICFGTETYLNSRLEMDIKDIIEKLIISKEEQQKYNVVKVYKEFNNENDVLEYYYSCKYYYEEEYSCSTSKDVTEIIKNNKDYKTNNAFVEYEKNYEHCGEKIVVPQTIDEDDIPF